MEDELIQKYLKEYIEQLVIMNTIPREFEFLRGLKKLVEKDGWELLDDLFREVKKGEQT